MFTRELFTENDKKLEYWIDYPKEFDRNKKYPIIFYFHGMGTVGNGIKVYYDNVAVRREYIPEGLSCIIVAPYCEKFTWIECFETLTAFIDYIVNKGFADDNKIYITGSSMGGYTCWALAVMYPDKFAGAVICCGGGMYFAADRIKFPVWAFHGKSDNIVLPRESEIMVERINAKGGNARLSIVDNCAHNVWELAFHSHDTYNWLLSKSKG